ncbi:MAG: MFS transporter [Myxococcota bacterium]|nr:MFS transporter [Myxococcota bacterium]
MSVGVSFGSFSVFLDPIARAFDATRMQVSLGQSLLMLVMTTAGLVVGPLLDRRSIRSIMTCGALLGAVCLVGMSLARELWQVGLLFGFGIALCVAMLGPLASSAVVAKWFETQRGRALGFTNMGGPAGGFVFALLGGALIGSVGWRTSLLIYAALVMAVIPAVRAVVRNRPEDLGLWPDGAERPPPAHADVPEPRSWTVGALLREPRFWLLVLPAGMYMGISTGWVAHIVPVGLDAGFGLEAASGILAVGALVGIGGTWAFGALADRSDLRALLWVILLAHLLGFLALTDPAGGWVFGAVVVVLGFVSGGLMPVYASLIGRLFGPASFGQVMGLGGFVMLPFAFAAPPVAGALRDASGSYASAFLVFAAGMGAASLLLAGLRTSRPARVAQPSEAPV